MFSCCCHRTDIEIYISRYEEAFEQEKSRKNTSSVPRALLLAIHSTIRWTGRAFLCLLTRLLEYSYTYIVIPILLHQYVY